MYVRCNPKRQYVCEGSIGFQKLGTNILFKIVKEGNRGNNEYNHGKQIKSEKIIKIFKEIGFEIVIKTEVDFLDVKYI